MPVLELSLQITGLEVRRTLRLIGRHFSDELIAIVEGLLIDVRHGRKKRKGAGRNECQEHRSFKYWVGMTMLISLT